MRDEIWKDVVGYEGLYKVSSLGRVKSLARWVSFKDTKRSVPERILSTKTNGNDYPGCNLSKAGKKKMHRVHRIVMRAFVGECPDGQEVLHLDSDKGNSELSNLRYGTHACNMAFKAEDGTDQSGEEHYKAGFSDAEIIEIRKMYDTGVSAIKIAKVFGCKDGTISAITSNATWKHLPHTKRKWKTSAMSVGDRNPNVKLTNKKVMRIREFASVGISIKELASTFNVGATAISRIIKRQSWKHVGGIVA